MERSNFFFFFFPNYICFCLLLLTCTCAIAQSQRNMTARELDSLLQNYAFKALVQPRTGTIYNASLPSDLAGVVLQVVRLRSGSLFNRGVRFMEFHVPSGAKEAPYVQRLALVYQNLGKLSSDYYGVPGFTFITPLVGLLAYDSTNLNAINLPELSFEATKGPISISFTNLTVPTGVAAKCVQFALNGSVVFSDLTVPNVCFTSSQGHFGVIVNSSALPPVPAPSPSINPAPSGPVNHGRNGNSNVWKIVLGSVLGGFTLIALLSVLVCVFVRLKRKSKLADMEKQADIGEALRTTVVGGSKAPAAGGSRTKPIIEDEYIVTG